MWRFMNKNTGAIVHQKEDKKTTRVVFSDDDSADITEECKKEKYVDYRTTNMSSDNSRSKRFKTHDAKFHKSTSVNRSHVITDKEKESDNESASENSDSEEDSDEMEESDDEDLENGDDNESEEHDYSSMTMEELLKLQEDMGVKKFKEKVLKVENVKEREKPNSFKRLNKNRPSEMPLMRKRAPRLNFLERDKKPRKQICRDPRFDNLSGELKMDLWDQKYEFLKKTRNTELQILKNELKEETNPVKKEKLKKMIQRMSNQEKESNKRAREREIKAMEKKRQREALRQGIRPKYVPNKEKKLLLKTMQFDELKKNNKVDKFLEKRERKQAKKEQRYKSSYRGSWRNY